jgi:hypothetical protein
MSVYSPRSIAERGWNALFNRRGRSLGNMPSPSLLWRSFESLRCMGNPREYLLGHAEESRVPSG